MSKWKRILIWAGIGVLVGGVYLGLFGVQTTSTLIVRYQFRKLPDVAKTPVPLSDLSISSLPHRTTSFFGYEFELPSDDVDEGKDKTFGTVQEMHSGFQPFRRRISSTELLRQGTLIRRI
jgi:hypothetical protein